MNSEKLLDRFALLLSRIFHPFIISVPAGLLFLYLTDISLLKSLKWISISATITILPTALFMKIHPDYYLRNINSRENRKLLYLIGTLELSVLAMLLWALRVPEIILMLSYSSVLSAIIGGLLNRFTKVSFHVSLISGFSTAIMIVSPNIGILSFIITLGVAWSRLRLERHTLLQVALGIITPASCITVVFHLLS
jgi:membrane-associated phospholipid phosphatase